MEKSGETKISQAYLQICRLLGLSLKFAKTVGNWGFTPDPTGELVTLSQIP